MTEGRKTYLKYLKNGECKIEFVKNDGTYRTMRATLSPDIIPKNKMPKEGASKKKTDPNLINVFDLDKANWRSFHVDSVTEFEYVVL